MNDQPVALVSGANRGIGAEVARQLAEDHGFLVLAGSRDPGKVAETESIRAIRLDVTDQASVDAAREQIESDPGRLDVLVNNAGITGPWSDTAAEEDLNQAHQVLETNLFGAWRLTQAMLPMLRRSEHPRIVNVSSGAGQLSDMNGGYPSYRMSKSALNALTRILSEEEAPNGILANSLCPGWVRTDMGGRGAPKSVEDGADTAVWLATLPDDGPSGGFFRNRKPIPW
jgi:NAD(P)-dependent dehydrogenase (short-subunit alcohol dehydrogenase family)